MIINNTRRKVIASKLHHCNSIFSRGSGLMFRSARAVDDTAWIFPLGGMRREAITMWFVRFPIDILLLDDKKRVVELKRDLRPWQWYFPKERACFLVELKVGSIRSTGTKPGDIIKF